MKEERIDDIMRVLNRRLLATPTDFHTYVCSYSTCRHWKCAGNVFHEPTITVSRTVLPQDW